MFDDSKFYRFADLKEMGLAPNWPTFRRWQAQVGFPPGTLIGPNFRAWTGRELNEFMATRPVGSATLKGAAERNGGQS